MPADTPRLTRTSAHRPGVGIVHLGLGAFFRAHGAIYIEEAMAASGGDWGIVGVSLMSPTQRDLLAPQDFAYTAVELGPDGETPRVVEVVQNVLVARENPEAVIAAMAYPAVRIVTLTVTEKGYCHEPSTGRLNRAHPDIVHDLAHPDAPRSAPGFLVRALARRRDDGLRPFTVLCCDNLPENGRLVRGVTLELARLIDAGLADWIEAEGAFPSTMVDRIVPATSPEDIERLTALTGVADLSPVMHEPFRQWVVEDRFVDGARPDLAAAGVQLVDDVTPFELMKLRMLNGTHSVARLSRLPRRPRDHRRHRRRRRLRRLRPPPLDAPRSSRPSPRRPARTSPPTPTRSSPATPTRGSATAPGRSRWTAARSCRSASSAPSPTTAPPAAPAPASPSPSPPGWPTSAAPTRRASRSTSATRWPTG